jgi:hypothetical protein
LLVEVAFFVVTVTFFVEVDGLTVEVILTVEVTRLALEEEEEEEEEAGRNIWAIRLSKFTRGCNESRERRWWNDSIRLTSVEAAGAAEEEAATTVVGSAEGVTVQ